MLVIAICALAVTWWLQLRKHAELKDARQEIQTLGEEKQYLNVLLEIYGSLDLEKSAHCKVMYMMKSMRYGYYSISWKHVRKRDTGFKVIAFHKNVHFSKIPYTSTVVLLRDDKLIDIISFGSSDERLHQVELEDVNDDGVIDVAFHCFGNVSNKYKSFVVTYEITHKGFARKGVVVPPENSIRGPKGETEVDLRE